jgi:hypothetical protein
VRSLKLSGIMEKDIPEEKSSLLWNIIAKPDKSGGIEMKNRSSENYLVRSDRFSGNITPTRRPVMRVYEENLITDDARQVLEV